MDDEHLGQRPQVKLLAGLLVLLAGRTVPRIVSPQLLLTRVQLETLGQAQGLLLGRGCGSHLVRMEGGLVLADLLGRLVTVKEGAGPRVPVQGDVVLGGQLDGGGGRVHLAEQGVDVGVAVGVDQFEVEEATRR